MRTVEIRTERNSLVHELGDMRLWLDAHRCEPSRLVYDVDRGEATICLDFTVDREAEAFSENFKGRLA